MRRVRRSLGVVARPLDTASPDLTVPSMVASRKKSRSKSIGPGGLDALKQSNGNRRQVGGKEDAGRERPPNGTH
jgi:kinetochore protein Spc7/SPC105